MRKILTIAFVILSLLACKEATDSSNSKTSAASSANSTGSGDSATVTAVDTSSTSSELDNYTVSDFSRYIYFHNTESKILVSYNFFPTGSDVCSQATYDEDTNPHGCQVDATVVVPCDFSDAVVDDDNLFVSISASDGGGSCSDIVIDMSGGAFTIDGLVFSFSSSLDVFDDDFGFTISSTAFVDSDDGFDLEIETVIKDDVALLEVYEAIAEK